MDLTAQQPGLRPLQRRWLLLADGDIEEAWLIDVNPRGVNQRDPHLLANFLGDEVGQKGASDTASQDHDVIAHRSPCLAHEEVHIAVVLNDVDQLMPCLGDPGRDVSLGARIAREHLEYLPHLALANAADEVHEGTGARHPPRVDQLVNLKCQHRAPPQMNTTWPSEAVAMKAATPSIPSTSRSRSSRFRWNMSIDNAHAWMSTTPRSFAW